MITFFQQMFYVAKAKRQLQMFYVAKAKRQVQVFGHLLKEGKASGGCHGIGKEFT